jgi:cyclophilin family peptidyl-prolyl cis-trans isomerase
MLLKLLQKISSRNPNLAARPRYRNLRMQFERLETREVLAGDVVAFLSGSELRLVGDDADNFVRIDLVGDNVLLRGESGTTINGGSSFTIAQNTTSINRSVLGDFGNGSDRIALGAGLSYTGTVHLTMGDGDDLVSLDSSEISADFAVIAGKGSDTIALRDSGVGGKILLNTDKGADTVSLQTVSVDGDLLIDLGKGRDALKLEAVLVGGFTNILTAAGKDTIVLQDSTFEAMFMSTGRGADVVEFNDSTADGLVQIHLDRGSDQMRFTEGTTLPNNFVIDGGSGSNAVNAQSQTGSGINRQVLNMQSTETSAELFDDRLNRPGTGLNDRVAAANELYLGNPVGELTLTVGADSTKVVQSSGTLLTKQSVMPLSGTTLPGATVELARDDDGLFNDGSVVAGADGKFTVNVTLLHNNENDGANSITVRSTDSLGRSVTEELNFHLAVGSVVRFNSVLGTMDFELLDEDAPETVENFLNYQTRYANSIVHRSAKSGGGDDFVIQGGGFGFNTSNQLVTITTDPPVQSEADPANSNIRGTLAMALPPNNPDGGTSQWFVNMANNSFLDAQDFTVFGRVVGEGMAVADQIHELATFNLVGLTSLSALTDTPLRNYNEFSQTIQGTVSITTGSNIVVGQGTKFTTDIPADQRIRIGTQLFTVLNVVSDTQLNLVANSSQTQSGVTAQVNAVPARTSYITMNSISELTLP